MTPSHLYTHPSLPSHHLFTKTPSHHPYPTTFTAPRPPTTQPPVTTTTPPLPRPPSPPPDQLAQRSPRSPACQGSTELLCVAGSLDRVHCSGQCTRAVTSARGQWLVHSVSGQCTRAVASALGQWPTQVSGQCTWCMHTCRTHTCRTHMCTQTHMYI